MYPTLQPESLLYNQNPHFNPHFATGCEGFLTSLLTDNVKAWNLQHHPLQQPCRLESNAGCNVGVLKRKCMCVYIYIYKPVLYVHGLQGGPIASYSQPFELYDVGVVDVVFTLLCHTSSNVIEFLFLCAIQNRRPPAPKPRATHPTFFQTQIHR